MVVGISGSNFTACTLLPTLIRWPAAFDAAGSGALIRTAWVKLWKHHAGQPEAA
jgi:hypothetical protein